jgi:membrane protein
MDKKKSVTQKKNNKPAPVEVNHNGKRLLEFVRVCVGNFARDKISIMASGVVYTTLISAVPFVSFLVAFLTLFNVLQPFFTLLTEVFVSIFGKEAGVELVDLLARYSKNASSLGVVGLISFLITSMLLIDKVWAVVNQIYRTSPTKHNLLRRSASYITILIVGALLLGSYISVKSLLNNWIARILGLPLFDNVLFEFLTYLVPWLIAWVCFFLLIIVAPNARVNLGSASIGALVGTVGVGVLNRVFSTLIAKVFTYSVIYGSFAAVFLALLWVYIMWVVVFTAVEVSYVHQYRPDRKFLKRPMSPAEQLANGVNVMMVIGQNFKTGEGETKVRHISEKLLMNDRMLFGVLDLLVEKQFIIATNTSRSAYIPARPLEDLRIVDLVSGLFGEVYLEQNLDTIGDSIASQINQRGIKTLGNLSLYNLLERV